MKHANSFTFERNHYFYGKLLTEHDFENEQKYGNDKRRLLNRYLFGAGIAAGLQVVAVDEKTISVETGFALDFTGREIVVDVPVMKKLSLIDGYREIMEQDDHAYCYLCAEYDEQPAGQVISAADNRQEFARYKEGYHLYLTTAEPENQNYQISSFYEQKVELYHDNDLKIYQVFPRIVKADSQAATKLVFVSERDQQEVSFHMTENLEYMTYQGENQLQIHVDHLLLGKGGTKEYVYELQVKHVSDCEVQIYTDQAVQLTVQNTDQTVPAAVKLQAEVTDMELPEALMEAYFKDNFEQIGQTRYMNGIYLAKLEMIKGGDLLIIDRIYNNPFEQRVYNNYLLAASAVLERQRDMSRGEKPEKTAGQTKPNYTQEQAPDAIRTSHGKVVIDMGIGGKRGQVYYSEQIVHGLGLGAVGITLSVENQECIYCGSQEVFPDMTARAELAARVNPKQGTFTIGARLLEATSDQKLTIYWTAYTAGSQRQKASVPRIYIKPNMLQLKTREETYLKAELEDMEQTDILWTCEQGDINQNGCYTAPNEPGIYEIKAACKDNENLSASVYAIVREEE